MLGAVVTNGLRLVVIAVLGRTLTSGDFGIVAAAVSVNLVLYNIRDIGVGTALVQRKELDPGHVTTAFALSTYLGLGVAAALFVTAPWLADLFNMSESAGVLRVLGLLFALKGVSTTSRMMTQRAMEFRSIALIETFAFAMGSIASMACAIGGMGPWALVVGYVVEELLLTVLYMTSHPTPISLRIDGARLRELLGFGTRQTWGQIIGILGNNGDNFVVAHSLGTDELGYYARAYNLITIPAAVFSNVVGSVLLPAFSKFQDDKARLADNYRRITFLNALVLLPASAAFIVLGPETIRILMGKGWDHAVLPFRILTVSMLMRTSQRLGTIVATAAGAVGAIAIAYTIYFLAIVGGAAIAVRWGIAGVATSTAIGLVICNLGTSIPALKVSGLRTRDMLAAHVPGLVVAALVAIATWPVTHALRAAHLPSPVVFAVSALVAIGVSLAAVAAWLRRGSGDFPWLGEELARVRRRFHRRA